MPVQKSVVLNGMCPWIETDRDSFLRAIELFQSVGIGSVEFYAEKDRVQQYGKDLQQRKLRSVFLAATAQKRARQSLCALHEHGREAAVKACIEMADQASCAGADAILITSGWRPAAGQEEPAYRALSRSLEQLRTAADRSLEIFLEPGDTDVEFCQLIGPTEQARRLVSGTGVMLTMDLSHTAQLREDPVAAFTMANPYTKHFHLANCVLKRESVLYGDKHPPFGVRDGVFSSQDAKEIFALIERLNADREVRVGMEIINRSGDPWAEIKSIIRQEEWFFSGRKREDERL
ncbi:MAG: sugar phosphate isomerase/epimerase [Muribaculaceae bacterium]|nr:sugar phosphate isomerase/epimerase [Muribaculaceae bacterium]